MTLSTIERAYQLARSGEVADLPSLKRRLQSEGCRAVEALLAARSLSGHLKAICAAAFRPGAVAASHAASAEVDEQTLHTHGASCPSPL